MLTRIVARMSSRQMSTKITSKSTAAQAIFIGSGVVGAGGLAYSLKHAISPADSAMIHNVGVWPQYVKDRLSGTFKYCLAGFGATALGGMAALRSPTAMRLFGGNGLASMFGCMALMIGSGMACQMVPFDGSPIGAKSALYYLHMGIVGGVIAPLVAFYGGAAGVRAAGATLSIMAGLAVTGMVAPNDAYIKMFGPVNAGMFLLLGASVVGMLAPPMGSLQLGIHSLLTFGGLVFFAGKGFMDLQHAADRAQQPGQFDPVNHALHITMDSINIFIRLLMIMGNNKRK